MSDLEVRVTVAADPETVWRDWTDATALAEWFWPPRLETVATVDHEAGTWRVRSDVAGIGATGKVRFWDPPERLELSWRWDGEESKTDVTLDIEPTDGGTEVRVRQGTFTVDTERDEHVQGWTDCLARLVERHGA